MRGLQKPQVDVTIVRSDELGTANRLTSPKTRLIARTSGASCFPPARSTLYQRRRAP